MNICVHIQGGLWYDLQDGEFSGIKFARHAYRDWVLGSRIKLPTQIVAAHTFALVVFEDH